MDFMLCRNRVADFSKWKAVFDSEAGARRAAGLELLQLWRGVDEPSHVFFVFQVKSIEKARAFVTAPEAKKAAVAAGVMEGELHFVTDDTARSRTEP
jgi:hypothetical protein